jgi:hypothetical protein
VFRAALDRECEARLNNAKRRPDTLAAEIEAGQRTLEMDEPRARLTGEAHDGNAAVREGGRDGGDQAAIGTECEMRAAEIGAGAKRRTDRMEGECDECFLATKDRAMTPTERVTAGVEERDGRSSTRHSTFSRIESASGPSREWDWWECSRQNRGAFAESCDDAAEESQVRAVAQFIVHWKGGRKRIAWNDFKGGRQETTPGEDNQFVGAEVWMRAERMCVFIRKSFGVAMLNKSQNAGFTK